MIGETTKHFKCQTRDIQYIPFLPLTTHERVAQKAREEALPYLATNCKYQTCALGKKIFFFTCTYL